MKRKANYLILGSLSLLIIIFFQNCSKGFQSAVPGNSVMTSVKSVNLASESEAIINDEVNNQQDDNSITINSEINTSLVSSITSTGKTYYVAPTGKDTNPGTKNLPFKTIPKTLTKGFLLPGDTVVIKPGKYPSFVVDNLHGKANKPITFKGEPAAVIDRHLGGKGGAVNIVIKGGSYLTFDGLEITDSDPVPPSIGCAKDTGNSMYRQGIKIYKGSDGKFAHHLTFVNLHIHHVRSQAILGAAIDTKFINNHVHHNGGKEKGWKKQAYGTYLEGTRLLIAGNKIHDNSGNGIRTGNISNSGIQNLLVDSVIENNLLYNNGGEFAHTNGNTGICRIVTGGDGIVVYGGSGNTVRNNIVINNAGYGIRVVQDFAVSKKPNAVLNNTVYKNKLTGVYTYPYPFAVNTDKTIIKNNITYMNLAPNISTNSPSVTNNLKTNPFFVNANAGNYKLLSNSPAIDKGQSLSEVLFDFSGKKRVWGNYDIGAYEWSK